MIVVDLNSVAYAVVSLEFNKEKVDEDLIRHIILSCLKSYKMKFGKEFGEIIIATDNRHYWRRDYFPFYKSGRKKARDSSGLNWPAIFEAMDAVKNELKDIFPYKFIDLYGAEADDIIGVIAQEMDYNDNLLVVSLDKDFIQIQDYNPFIKQWDPIRKRWLSHPHPDKYLEEHVIRGDAGDGIPNIRSDGNSFAIGKRQKSISKKMVEEWMTDLSTLPEELKSNYERNSNLIDLRKIPENIKNAIKEELAKEPTGSRAKLQQYFFDKNLKQLTETIGDF